MAAATGWNLFGFLHLTWNVTLTVLQGIWDVPLEGSGEGRGEVVVVLVEAGGAVDTTG